MTHLSNKKGPTKGFWIRENNLKKAFEEFNSPRFGKLCGKCDCGQQGDVQRLLFVELRDIPECFRNTR